MLYVFNYRRRECRSSHATANVITNVSDNNIVSCIIQVSCSNYDSRPVNCLIFVCYNAYVSESGTGEDRSPGGPDEGVPAVGVAPV